jgi:hypothetical protein
MTHEVLLVITGNGDDSVGRRAMIESDTTVADLLRAADLNPSEWQLQIKNGEKLVSLQSEDKLLDHVQAGEKVYAYPSRMVVGVAT